MLKNIFIMLLLGPTAAQAEAVKTELLKSKSWTAAVIQDHAASKKTVCLAFVESNDKLSRLEVYSEQSENGGFVEPTVQILLKNTPPVLGGQLLPDRGRNFAMTAVFAAEATAQPAAVQVLLAKYEDRADLVEAIRQRNTLQLTVFNKKGAVKKLTFSLSGSSNAVKKQFEHCGLEITE